MNRNARWAIGAALALSVAAPLVPRAQQQPQTTPQFGGSYSTLDGRRKALVENWVARFNTTTSQNVEAGPFYDEIVMFSTKTTFEAVTNALEQSRLTDATGAALGDALSLLERVDSVHGYVPGVRGDEQFRMYVRLTPSAVDTLKRSNEFKRGADNSVYHKGYPQNYREQGGAPSIQISIAADNRRADIDVDYRSSSFPTALFNGHLTAANSDVRAGNNYDRHIGRWAGFENWWRNFFGVGVNSLPDTPDVPTQFTLPRVPRAGKKTIDAMMNDFLTAWLIEGNAAEAQSYISRQAYSCLAENGGSPADIDPGMAPFRLMASLKAAHDTVGPHQSLVGLTTGVRLATPALKLVQQSHHAQFVLYRVPDDIAAAFECEQRLTGAPLKEAERQYGNYFGAMFFLEGRKDTVISLLWARQEGYRKIVSWKVGIETRQLPPPEAPPEEKVARIPADSTLVDAANGFLESWFVRKDYDKAFSYLSEQSYACYNLIRDPEQPAATSAAESAQQIRAGMERAGGQAGTIRKLDQIIASVEPVHPAVRVMNHPYARQFALTNVPKSLADAADCAMREKNAPFAGVTASDYDQAFGMNFRFRTTGSEAPTLKALWVKDKGNWRITAFDVEVP